ncbi:RHS repeat domain-containing protein, partial [Klebsiella pneumoniae]
TYVGSSKLIDTISETDGSHLKIDYDGAGRVIGMRQAVESGVTRDTAIAYGAGYTSITDPTGQVTTLHYDGAGQLVRITAPAAYAGAAAQV